MNEAQPDALDFTSLYERHAGAVMRFALYLCGNRAQAEDITSETFVRVWTARDRLDLGTITGYLVTIARHLYLQGLARGRRVTALDVDPEDPSPDPQQAAEGRAELDAVLADLQRLPEVDRAALLMRAQDQISYNEIEAALEISVGAAKVKVHRARLKLAELRLARKG
ncbi:MAG: sigma-70 family RNA polymerase sigma factor [Acidobacteria bacterium]|nr:sigma-70 family RNA polymerase sigma factor [Acidobacteriota bacterium]